MFTVVYKKEKIILLKNLDFNESLYICRAKLIIWKI